MPKPHKTIAQLSHNVRRPRPGAEVYQEYNGLRQRYILEAAARHFRKREDDPAPLYGKTLLDVGCGESTISEFLALSGAEITAVDPNPKALARARASAQAFGAPINFVQTRAENLVRGTAKYDVILALDILEDTEDPAKLIWALRQLLAPGGIIIFSTINRTFRAWLIHIFASSIVYRRTRRKLNSFWRFYTPQQLRRVCKSAGLKLSHVQGLRFSLTKMKWKQSSTPRTRYMATATQESDER